MFICIYMARESINIILTHSGRLMTVPWRHVYLTRLSMNEILSRVIIG